MKKIFNIFIISLSILWFFLYSVNATIYTTLPSPSSWSYPNTVTVIYNANGWIFQWWEDSISVNYTKNNGWDYDILWDTKTLTKTGCSFTWWVNTEWVSITNEDIFQNLNEDTITLNAKWECENNWDNSWENDQQWSLSYLSIIINNRNPLIDEWLELIVHTSENYTGKIYFNNIKYYSDVWNKWITIPKHTNEYISDYSEYLWLWYTMTDADNWIKSFPGFIKFKKAGKYIIYAEDKYWISDFIQFEVKDFNSNSNWNSNSSNLSSSSSSSTSSSYSEYIRSDLTLFVNNNKPSVNEYIDLVVNTNSRYTDKIYFTKVQYYQNESGKRMNISKTSSTYIADYSSYLQSYYTMSSSDEWIKTIRNFIKFAKPWKYRICAEDKYWISDYIQITIDETEENNNTYYDSQYYNIYLTTNNKYPFTKEPINLTIQTDSKYTWKLSFSAKYREDSEESRRKISSLISSTYFSDYSIHRENWYYNLSSSNNGKITLDELVSFSKEWYYRIYVTDIYNNNSYIEFSTINNETDTSSSKKTTSTSSNSSTLNNTYQSSNTSVITVWNSSIEWNTKTNWSTSTGNNMNSIMSGSDTHGSALENHYSDFTYTSRSCKEYTLHYSSDLEARTSPNLNKAEYFISVDYLERYIDSKNLYKTWCQNNQSWITTSYVDKLDRPDRYIAPNGKVYWITNDWNRYTSPQLSIDKKFETLSSIKYFIRDHNPMIGI